MKNRDIVDGIYRGIITTVIGAVIVYGAAIIVIMLL